MIVLITLGLVIVILIRPKDLLTKIFRVEEIELLHRRNKKELAETYSVRDWSVRTLWKVCLYGLAIFFGGLTIFPWFIPMTAAVSLATICAVAWFAISLRFFAKYRADVVPLYLALTRISGSRWTPLDSPMKWVRCWPDEIRIRLPRDQHTTPLMVKQINDLVTSRLRGQWTMKADIPGFLLTFSESRPVPVSVGTTENTASQTVTPTVSDTINVQVLSEDENDSGPW